MGELKAYYIIDEVIDESLVLLAYLARLYLTWG